MWSRVRFGRDCNFHHSTLADCETLIQSCTDNFWLSSSDVENRRKDKARSCRHIPRPYHVQIRIFSSRIGMEVEIKMNV